MGGRTVETCWCVSEEETLNLRSKNGISTVRNMFRRFLSFQHFGRDVTVILLLVRYPDTSVDVKYIL